MRRTRIIKCAVYKIKTPYAASEKQMRRIVCISSIQRQHYMQKNTKRKIKTNNKIKTHKTENKTHKNSKYANYTMNAINLIYNKSGVSV